MRRGHCNRYTFVLVLFGYAILSLAFLLMSPKHGLKILSSLDSVSWMNQSSGLNDTSAQIRLTNLTLDPKDLSLENPAEIQPTRSKAAQLKAKIQKIRIAYFKKAEAKKDDYRDEFLKGFHDRLDSSRTSGGSQGSRVGNGTGPILIATTWRSGSTFLGELLAQIPGTFYSFEPLMHHNLRNETLPPDELIVEHLLGCNFSDIQMQESSSWPLKHNKPYIRACKKHFHGTHPICWDSTTLRAACHMFPIHLIKTVRLTTLKVEHLLTTIPRLKVVSLIRDPRGISNSRKSMPWCQSAPCKDPHIMCQRYNQDVQHAIRLRTLYPGQVFVLRYEDLSLNVLSTTSRLLSFLGQTSGPHMMAYIRRHSLAGGQVGSGTHIRGHVAHQAHHTMRQTQAHTFAWRSSIPMADVVQMQNLCSKGMELMGYNNVTFEAQLWLPTFELMQSELRAGNGSLTNWD